MIPIKSIPGKPFNALKTLVRNNTSSKNLLMQQAIQLTSEMGANYPELYVFLDETPLFLSAKRDNQIYIADFKRYLETLKSQLQSYIDMHRI